MKVKVNVKVDEPLLLALNEFVCSNQPTDAAILEIKHLARKILKNVNKKTKDIDLEMPEFRSLSDIE